MADYDFEVDLEALVKAAQTTAEVVQLKKDNDVCDYVPTQDALANDTVWQAVDEFQERWERGINDMTEDISEVAGRLGKVAMTYLDYDEQAAQAVAGVKATIAGLSREPLLGGQP